MSSDDRLDKLDYYTLLGVKREAGIDEIKAAFRAFARRYHPDRFAGQDGEKIERATRIYRRGSEAYQTLTDLESRRAYDAGLAKGALRLQTEARRPQPSAPRPEQNAAPTAQQPAIRSPSARAFFARAQELARAGDLKGAWAALKSARDQEPDNPLIEAALQKVENGLRQRR